MILCHRCLQVEPLDLPIDDIPADPAGVTAGDIRFAIATGVVVHLFYLGLPVYRQLDGVAVGDSGVGDVVIQFVGGLNIVAQFFQRPG